MGDRARFTGASNKVGPNYRVSSAHHTKKGRRQRHGNDGHDNTGALPAGSADIGMSRRLDRGVLDRTRASPDRANIVVQLEGLCCREAPDRHLERAGLSQRVRLQILGGEVQGISTHRHTSCPATAVSLSGLTKEPAETCRQAACLGRQCSISWQA